MQYLPHIDLLLQSLRINRERLDSRSKIAIEAKLLKSILQTMAEDLPFSEEFYLQTYPDIAEAYEAGKIPDLRRHYVELGFFEGRLGARPPVDEAYYNQLYPDVAAAVQRGDVKSAAEHYMRSGAAEGRIPNAELKPAVEGWANALRNDVRV
jgi:hypothetical protein